MSFGFAVGDFIAVGELALKLYKDIYKVARIATAEVNELAKELSVLSTSLQLLTEEAQNPQSVLVQSGEARVSMVNEMISNTKETLTKLEAYAEKHELLTDSIVSRPLLRRTWDKLKFSKDASTINGLRVRISYHCGVINMLLTSIGNSSLERLHSESQSIARNTDEVLSLLRNLSMDRSPGPGLHPAALISSPIISTSEADMVKDELSFEFLHNVEDHDQCSWLETSIDLWLDRGRYWWSKARFAIAKLRVLKRSAEDLRRRDRHAGDLARRDRAYKAAVTALLKASWIVMNVVRNHPMRTYITSGHRQLLIRHLSNDITTEMKALRTVVFNPVLSVTDLDDFEIAIRERMDGGHRALESCFIFQPVAIETGPLAPFQCLAEMRINAFVKSVHAPRSKPPKCLVRLEGCPSGLGIQLAILGSRAFEANLMMERSEWELGLMSSPTTERLETEIAATCYIWSEKRKCVPITFEVYSQQNGLCPVVRTILLRLRNLDDEIVSALRNVLQSRLEQTNRRLMRELRYLFENYTEAVHARAIISPGASKRVHYAQHIHEACLIETVARAMVLDDCAKITGNFERSFDYPVRIRVVSETYKNRINSFLGGIYGVVREYRWWMEFELSAAEDIHHLNDEELANGVLECMQNWKWPTPDRGKLIHNVSPSRTGLADIMEITGTKTVEEAVQ